MIGAGVISKAAVAEQRANEIAQKAEVHTIPLHAMVELTHRCNLDCVHCYCQHLDTTRGRRELRTREWTRVLDELAELGVLHLTLTGGEILVRPDFWEIARHAKARRFSLTLFTNGTLITEAVADSLADLRPTSIEMSLLGATEQTHDRLARANGAWRRTLRAADLLRERSLAFVLKTTLMRENFRELAELERTATGRGCRAYRIGTEISPRNDGSLEPEQHRIGPCELFDYYVSAVGGAPALPVEQPTRGPSRDKSLCGAGSTGCAVDPYGDLLPCLQLFLPFGSARERSLRQMWEDPPDQIRRLRSATAYGDLPACLACDLIDYCRRCHGLALLETGAWESCDSRAREMAEMGRQVARHLRDGAALPAAAAPERPLAPVGD
ncbi:MAG: radical SAM protein [Candidatus Methylomirabilota bacterium]